MRPAAKLSSFAAALVVVLAGGAALGAAVGPIELGDDPESHGGDGHAVEPHDLTPAGLQVSEAGYTLVPDSTTLGTEFGFVVTGPDGVAVDRFDVVHDKELHLVVASRDLRRFAHVHPERGAGGHWRVTLPQLPPGPYRAFADLRPTGGPALVLGVDLLVPGDAPAPAPLEPSAVVEVDGYEVTLDGRAEPGTTSTLTVTVRRDGEVVTTSPYLGAAGHLVALRAGDLAYLHVHPLDEEPAGPVGFGVELPSAGTYALFFDFLVDGTVHTAPFVLEVTP